MMYVLNALQEVKEFDILYLGANLNDKSDAELNWQLSAEEFQLSDKDKIHPSLANAKDLFE